MLITNQPFTVYYNIEKAKELADKLQTDENDGWNYLVQVSPNGKSAVIQVYDEEGYLLGNL